MVTMILDTKPTVVWTHACHQKVASGTKNDYKTTKVNTAKVWFGRVPVDKIALPMFLDNKQQCRLDPRLEILSFPKRKILEKGNPRRGRNPKFSWEKLGFWKKH